MVKDSHILDGGGSDSVTATRVTVMATRRQSCSSTIRHGYTKENVLSSAGEVDLIGGKNAICNICCEFLY